jgi:hypothetical protein
VLESAAEIQTTRLEVVPVTDSRGVVYGPAVVIKHKLGSGVEDEVQRTEISPIVITNGLMRILPEVTFFIRGDSNTDGSVDLADAVTTLGYLFLGNRAPTCIDAADANDDGMLDVSDSISTLLFLFRGGDAPPPPYPDVGKDLTVDKLDCRGQ